MGSLWTKLEEELDYKFPDTERNLILSAAVEYFIHTDLRYTELEGALHTKDPEKFREALIRKFAKPYADRGRDHATSSDPKSESTNTSEKS